MHTNTIHAVGYILEIQSLTNGLKLVVRIVQVKLHQSVLYR